MKLLNCSARNFASYKELDINFSNLGLTLVSGPTGSGKSTLPDIPCWCIFGTTSKDSNADDIIPWTSSEPTIVVQEVEVNPGELIIITRVRGKASENDLYWTEGTSEDQIRGKNLIETQKLLEKRLGVDSDLYFTSSYFHQFSKSDTFFISKANERREVFEKIVDQAMAIDLSQKSSDSRKEVKKVLEKQKLNLSLNNGKLSSTTSMLSRLETASCKWQVAKTKEISDLSLKSDNFEQDKRFKVKDFTDEIEILEKQIATSEYFEEQLQSVEALIRKIDQDKKEYNRFQLELQNVNSQLSVSSKELKSLETSTEGICSTCLGPLDNDHRAARIECLQGDIETLSDTRVTITNKIKELEETIKSGKNASFNRDAIISKKHANDRLLERISNIQNLLYDLKNKKNDYLERIEEVKIQENPYINQILEEQSNLESIECTIKSISNEILEQEHKLALLNLLYDLSFDLRGALLNKVISEIESDTNKFLEKYFNSLISVSFSLVDADKLEVEIQKDGNTCNFKQLSGGQRCLLKLCFWLAIKKAAENKASKAFSIVSLDEAFNGLDDNLKEQAFGLLQELENTHETVLVIEHSESFKNLFANEIKVSMIGDNSILEC